MTAPPPVSVCLQLMEEYEMLPNIRRHSFMVAGVAERIHARLAKVRSADCLPERSLVTAGALLHDIAKTGCLENGGDHARVGGEICAAKGYAEIAEIVREHVRLRHYDVDRYSRGLFTAKELIFYADKRVVHDRVVSLERRLEYILEHYGAGDPVRRDLIRRNFANCRRLEEHICTTTGCDPEELLIGLPDPVYEDERP